MPPYCCQLIVSLLPLFLSGLLPYFTYLSFYYYVLYMHSGSVNKCRRGCRHESRGECHGNACNLFAPVVLLGPSGPWLHYPVTRFNARDWHHHLCANDGCWDRDADRVIECPAGAACAVVTSGDIISRVPPLNTIFGPYSGQSIAVISRGHLPSRVVLPPDPLRGPYWFSENKLLCFFLCRILPG